MPSLDRLLGLLVMIKFQTHSENFPRIYITIMKIIILTWLLHCRSTGGLTVLGAVHPVFHMYFWCSSSGQEQLLLMIIWETLFDTSTQYNLFVIWRNGYGVTLLSMHLILTAASVAQMGSQLKGGITVSCSFIMFKQQSQLYV